MNRSTLWETLDRLRYARALLLAQFIVSWTMLLTVPVFAGVLVTRIVILLPRQYGSSPPSLFPQGDSLGRLLAWSAVVAAVLGVLFIFWAMSGGREWRYLARLGARRVMPGECEKTRDALHDIALAAGLNPVPALYLIPDDESVNAVVLGRSAGSAAVAVTTGMAYRCPKDTQRAVLAGLLSRFRNGGVGWTTVRYMLMEPISGVIHKYGEASLLVLLLFEGTGLMAFSITGIIYGTPSPASRSVGSLLVAAIVAISAVVAVGGVFDSSFRRNYAALVLSADTEGVTLLREPTVMLSTLRLLLSVNSSLAQADGFSSLAFVDPSRTSTLECPTALDRQRLQLLEELAFACPSGSVTSSGIASLESPVNQSPAAASIPLRPEVRFDRETAGVDGNVAERYRSRMVIGLLIMFCLLAIPFIALLAYAASLL